MSENETVETKAPAKEHNPKRTAVLVGIAVALAIVLWLVGSKYLAVGAAERQGVIASASALSVASMPLLDLRSKNLLGDAETLQRVVDEVVSSQNFSFAAVLDAQGRVVAASDRNVSSGTAYQGFESGEVVQRSADGKFEVIYPIRQNDVVYGAVVLRAR